MRQHYNGETATLWMTKERPVGRHRAEGKFGIFTFGAIPMALSFERILGKRRWGRGARPDGISAKIKRELYASHYSWLHNPISAGRHHIADFTERTVPSMRPVGV